MTRFKHLLTAAALLAAAAVPVRGQGLGWTRLNTPAAVADTARAKGVSAAFCGLLGGRVVLAGGCNFPARPAADGGVKRFYADIFVGTPVGDGLTWRQAGRLPSPAAYGVALPTDDGLALIGGTTSDGPTADVCELHLTAAGTHVALHPLPALPVAVDNAAGARLGRRLYVVGGNAAGQPSRRVFSLHLDSLGAGWREEAPLPGEPRTQAVAVALGHGGESCLYVFGGFAAAAGGRPASLSLTSLRYRPSARRWEPAATPAAADGTLISLGGGAGLAMADTAAICLGGVDGDIFLAALRREERLARARAACNDSLVAALEAAGRRYMTQPAAWYRFNRLVLRYSAAADRWTVVGEAPQAARAGAALTGDGTTLYWLGGELKPGVRTPEAWRIDLP